MAVNIRPMAAEDKITITKILQVTSEFTSTEVKVALELIDLYLEHGVSSDYHILVAEVDDATSGYICFGPTPLADGTWDIYWMAVDPGKQRQGIGRRLLNQAEVSIMKVKGRLILIETSSKPEYEKTRTFYESCGYETIARIPDFYIPGDDKIVFQKRLY
ncbi:MAG: GNAT family N-acetyltransferase [Dehalococcoidales bacterium]|nr:MAG: GNAT family N-acetyltransferase [Dehalococcoidales bacterium]